MSLLGMFSIPVMVLIFIPLTYFWVKRLVTHDPFLEVDDKGITFHSPKYGFIPWKDIQSVRGMVLQAGLNKVQLAIVTPRDPVEFANRYKGWTRYLVDTNLKHRKGLSIPLQALPVKPREFTEALELYARDQILRNAVAPPVQA
jgi:hypothetical protein